MTWLYHLSLYMLLAVALWFPCCCRVPPPPCEHCTSDADSLSVTFAGAVDGDCDCDWINATFIVTRSAGDMCTWRNTGKFSCSYGRTGHYTVTLRAQMFLIGLSVRMGWAVRLDFSTDDHYGPGNVALYRWINSAPGDFDCTATRIAAFQDAASIPAFCLTAAWPSSTCQVN